MVPGVLVLGSINQPLVAEPVEITGAVHPEFPLGHNTVES